MNRPGYEFGVKREKQKIQDIMIVFVAFCCSFNGTIRFNGRFAWTNGGGTMSPHGPGLHMVISNSVTISLVRFRSRLSQFTCEHIINKRGSFPMSLVLYKNYEDKNGVR